MKTSQEFDVLRTNGADVEGHTHVRVSVNYFKSRNQVFLCMNDERQENGFWSITMLGVNDFRSLLIREMPRFNQARFDAISAHVERILDKLVYMYCELPVNERQNAIAKFMLSEFGDRFGNVVNVA